MGQYIYAWVTVAVLAALAEMLLPGGKGGKTAGHVRFLAGICILAALIPVIGESVTRIEKLMERDDPWLIPEGDASQNYEERFEEQMKGVVKEAYENQAYELLQSEFSISREDCKVSADVARLEDGTVAVSRISVCLWGKAALAASRLVSSRLESRLSVPCDVRTEMPHF